MLRQGDQLRIEMGKEVLEAQGMEKELNNHPEV